MFYDGFEGLENFLKHVFELIVGWVLTNQSVIK